MDESPKDLAHAIKELAGPDGLVLASTNAPFIAYYTDCRVLAVTDQVDLALRRSGHTRDDVTYSMLSAAMTNGETVIMSKPTLWYLKKNDILFPRTLEYVRDELRRQDLGKAYRLSLPSQSR